MAGRYVVSDVTGISKWKSIRKIVAEELDKFKLKTKPLQLTWKYPQSFSVVLFPGVSALHADAFGCFHYHPVRARAYERSSAE